MRASVSPVPARSAAGQCRSLLLFLICVVCTLEGAAFVQDAAGDRCALNRRGLGPPSWFERMIVIDSGPPANCALTLQSCGI